MTRLSVNINKIATLRNSRGGDNPNLVKVHIRYQDVQDLSNILTTEFNIEGNPKEDKFVALVLAVKPAQVTLVPDVLSQLTSDHGWDTISEQDYLKNVIAKFKNAGIRVSIFVDPDEKMVQAAATTGTDRIELYTEMYAKQFATGNKEAAIAPYITAAALANQLGMGINAGHDLDRFNLPYLIQQIPNIDEVSIGHALISDALYLGLENTIQLYNRALVK
ncbi:MAG: pyridoxine 5'-phosphate synthase [Chitinophagia bacterium]|nr:pyridoxine 5'-phosphate synthase [Chitinophagia bacterium]